MSTAYPTTQSIITMAARLLGIIGTAETEPAAEVTAVFLDVYNQLIGQFNKRKRISAFFMQKQAFTFTTSKQSYTIGTAANGADFQVQQGERPERIEYAQLVITDTTPYTYIAVRVINWEQQVLIAVPALSSQFPLTLYYQADWPNGVLTPYPAFPTETSFQLNLTWWRQLVRIDISEIANDLLAPNGYDSMLSTALAVRCYLMFPGRADLEELKRAARIAESDCSSVNVQPPKISSNDGINTPGDFDWRSRTFV